jgi:hypothetical protein
VKRGAKLSLRAANKTRSCEHKSPAQTPEFRASDGHAKRYGAIRSVIVLL